jgi:hypothetical protein
VHLPELLRIDLRQQLALTPSPRAHWRSSGITRYKFGTTFSPPASPPSPPWACWLAGAEKSLRNLIDGVIRWIAPATWRWPSLAMPAELLHSVAASSAAAAPPANALPRPLAEFSLIWKPAPETGPAPAASMATASAPATRVGADAPRVPNLPRAAVHSPCDRTFLMPIPFAQK